MVWLKGLFLTQLTFSQMEEKDRLSPRFAGFCPLHQLCVTGLIHVRPQRRLRPATVGGSDLPICQREILHHAGHRHEAIQHALIPTNEPDEGFRVGKFVIYQPLVKISTL